VAVTLDRGMRWSARVLGDAGEVWAAFRDAELMLFDVPIGLAETGQRACDREAKAFLGRRGASVFMTPCREAVWAATYEEASRINEERTGAKLSKQAWNIVPKIREVDGLLAAEPGARERIREMHPEVCFAALAGAPIGSGKATPDGQAHRLEALEAAGVPAGEILAAALAGHRRRVLTADDVLDAVVGARTALAGPGGLVTIPAEPEHDARGLPMQMVRLARPVPAPGAGRESPVDA
jgi:predicted RNase H-like nuclease